MLYGTFEAQIPNAKLDSVSSIEMIDGLTFHTFKVAITYPNKMVMDFWMFSRVFGENEFTVNLMTIDKTKQGMVLNSWRKSRFGIK